MWNVAVSVPAEDGRKIKELRIDEPERCTEVARRRLFCALQRCAPKALADRICGTLIGGFKPL
jgi:hypothetical protein